MLDPACAEPAPVLQQGSASTSSGLDLSSTFEAIALEAQRQVAAEQAAAAGGGPAVRPVTPATGLDSFHSANQTFGILPSIVEVALAAQNTTDDIVFDMESILRGRVDSQTPFDGSDKAHISSFMQRMHSKVAAIVTPCHASGKATPHCADLLDVVQQHIQPHSVAALVFEQCRAAAEVVMQRAEDNMFHLPEATDERFEAMLGAHANEPEYRLMAQQRILEQFSAGMAVAANKGWQYISASTTPAPLRSSSGAAEKRALALTPGRRVTPHMYAYHYTMLLFEIHYSIATQQQENEFKTMVQGTKSLEAFANDLQRLRKSLLHLQTYTEEAVAIRFIDGLTDKQTAEALKKHLASTDAAKHTLAEMLRTAVEEQRVRQAFLQSQTEAAVAATVLKGAAPSTGGTLPGSQGGAAGKSGGTGGSGGSRGAAALKSLREEVKQQLGPDHPDALCKLHLQGIIPTGRAACSAQPSRRSQHWQLWAPRPHPATGRLQQLCRKAARRTWLQQRHTRPRTCRAFLGSSTLTTRLGHMAPTTRSCQQRLA